MLEREVQSDLIQGLEGVGAKCFPTVGSVFQRSGWPDLQVYHRIWTGHLELKIHPKKLKPIQRNVMKDLNERGMSAWGLVYDSTTRMAKVEDAEGLTLRSLQEFLGQIGKSDGARRFLWTMRDLAVEMGYDYEERVMARGKDAPRW